MRCLSSSIFFLQWVNLICPSLPGKKKKNLWRKYKVPFWSIEFFLPFDPPTHVKGGRHLPKHMGHNLKEKKGGSIHFITWLLIGCMEILFLKFGCPYFWPWLRALPKSTLPIVVHIDYFTGVFTLLSFLEGAILAHHQLFWEHWALPNRSTSVD
jgi:hypothetical protein